MVELDSLDLAILRELQADCARSIQSIGDAVGLSQNPCWRSIRRLEEEGVIRARVALVDPATVGSPIVAFVGVRTSQHSEEWLARFSQTVATMPEVVECYRTSGEIDYLVKVVVADIPD